MPSSRDVVDEACSRLKYTPGQLPTMVVRKNFNKLLYDLFLETLVVLEEFERQVDAGKILPAFVEGRKVDIKAEYEAMEQAGSSLSSFEQAVTRLVQRWHEPLRGVFLSIRQSRMTRGGKDFELEVEKLLDLAGIPFIVQTKRERSDFILPTYELLQNDRPKAVLVSAKRTLRERWQQVVDELARVGCPNTYLATADDNISNEKVAEIRARNIYLVVWDDYKASKFPKHPAVRSYSEFIELIVGHFLPQWP